MFNNIIGFKNHSNFRNLENNPLSCQCENKWIQDAGLNQNRNHHLLDHHWPRITLSSFPRLNCKDAYSLNHQLESYKFQRCGKPYAYTLYNRKLFYNM